MVISEQLYRKAKHLDATSCCNGCIRRTREKCTPCFDIFSGSSDLSNLQATEFKFVECLNTFAWMCVAKLKNDRKKDNVRTECAKTGNILLFFFLIVISAVCISLLFYRSSKVPVYTLRDTSNNFLIQ